MEEETEEGAGAKVTRGLSVHVDTIKKGHYALAFKDRTTRADGVQRITTEKATTDSGSRDACVEKFALMLKSFEASLKDEKQGELYGEMRGEKPRRDPKA